jgi:hypothetical protein
MSFVAALCEHLDREFTPRDDDNKTVTIAQPDDDHGDSED